MSGEETSSQPHDLTWELLLEALPDGTAVIDGHGVMRHVNDQLATLTGYRRDELVGQHVLMLVPARFRDMEFLARSEISRHPHSPIIWSDLSLTALRKDESEFPVDFALSPLTFGHHRWAVSSIRDNSAHLQSEHARVETERHFRLAFEDNMAPMVFTDLGDRIIAANDAFCQMVGRTRAELIGYDSKPFTYPEDVGITEASHERIVQGEVEQVRYVKRYLHRDGRTIIAEVSKSPARDEAGNTLYFIISERDITEERTLTAQLSHQALHDPLTGLANRALFEDRLAQAHSRILRQGGNGALLLLDLDDFKGVNDTHGHVVGDELLIEVARRLEAVTRASDTLCRFGGDEFLYLAEDISGVSEAEVVATRLLASLEAPFAISEPALEQRASVGIVVWDAETREFTNIVRDADVALYEAKRLGKGRHVVYAPGMHQQAVTRYSLVQQLRQALPTGEIAMYYQPIVLLPTGEITGFEALMRWRRAEGDWVPPSLFIPLAEQSDLILELGAFALRTAIEAASRWKVRAAPGAEPLVSVNLSARQFHDPGMVASIKSELAASGLPPDRLIIEITEGVALWEVADTMSRIDQLAALGVGLALDDFGTGFSSLAYLARLNPMIIKVDQSFVRPPQTTIHNDRLLETIISLGHNLGMTMLAEGIETRAQLEQLRSLNCSLGQGFLYSPAVPFEEALTLIGKTFDV